MLAVQRDRYLDLAPARVEIERRERAVAGDRGARRVDLTHGTESSLQFRPPRFETRWNQLRARTRRDVLPRLPVP
jgi:hypothetical protein